MDRDENEKREFLVKPKETLQKGKNGLLHVVFGRTGIIFLLVAIQVGILILGFSFLGTYVFAASWATVFLGWILVVSIINRKGNPAFQIAWIVPILTVPVFGALFYLYFNMQLGARKLNQRILEELDATSSLVPQIPEVSGQLREESAHMANLAQYLRRSCGTAAHTGTSATYYGSGEAFLEPMLTELRSANKFIFMEYFIVSPGYMWDCVLEILKAKAKEGVEVRFLYDGFCDMYNFPKDYPRKLESFGIKCRVFAPVMPVLSTVQNNRDHRKILVIDGQTAFTGGLNLADEYINKIERFGYWKDCAVMLKGNAVRSFTLMFLRMWEVVDADGPRGGYDEYINLPLANTENARDGYVIPYDDNPLDGEQVGELVYLDILNTAREYVHIMTPYLVLDHEMVVALKFAARRGVDIKIMMPHIPDKQYAFLLARTYYNELLEAGVQIYEFLPGFVHTKAMVSDGEKAVVGSINMDFRSFYLSFECGVLLYRNEEILAIEADFQKTLEECVKVTEDFYKKQPLPHRIAGKVLRLFAPLM